MVHLQHLSLLDPSVKLISLFFLYSKCNSDQRHLQHFFSTQKKLHAFFFKQTKVLSLYTPTFLFPSHQHPTYRLTCIMPQQQKTPDDQPTVFVSPKQWFEYTQLVGQYSTQLHNSKVVRLQLRSLLLAVNRVKATKSRCYWTLLPSDYMIQRLLGGRPLSHIRMNMTIHKITQTAINHWRKKSSVRSYWLPIGHIMRSLIYHQSKDGVLKDVIELANTWKRIKANRL